MNRNDKLTISYGLLVDTADAIRAKKGTSALIDPSDFPSEIESISGGGESPTLTLGYTFGNNKASNAYGTVTLTSYDSAHDGNYDLYWANDDGILPNYTKLNMLTVLAVDHTSTPTVFDKFNQYNAIPKYATKLVAVLASDNDKAIKATYNIPSSKLWQSGDWGNKKGTEGWLSDVHYQYDTGSDDWARCFTYCDEREDCNVIKIDGDYTSKGTQSHLEAWKTARDTYAVNTPVCGVNGNHESIQSSSVGVTNPSDLRQYIDTDYNGETVNYYTKTINGILNVFVPIFEGVLDSRGNTMFSSEVLAWVENVLEEHRNERVILWSHCLPNNAHKPYGFGDCNGVYHSYKSWGYSDADTLQDRFDWLDLIDHYKNVVWVTGHTHIRYYYQEQYPNLNVVRQTGGGAYLVHLSSVTVPRDIIEGSAEYVYAESEGTICDVYENCLRLRSRDFAGEKFYGLCEYIIENDIETIPAKTKVLDSITATKTNVSYNVGDTLDLSDIVTTAHFTDSSSETVQGTYDTQNVNMLVAGTYNIGVSYTFNGVTETASISITVADTQTKALASLSASKSVVQYTVGDNLDTSDITATATYTDSTSADVSSSVQIDTSQVDMSTAGTYPIGVSYAEDGVTKSATINITVSSSGVNPTIILDATFNGTISAKSGAVTPTVNDSKGIVNGDYVYYTAHDASEGQGKALYYRFVGTPTGIDGAHEVGVNAKTVSSFNSSSGETVMNYTQDATSWTKLQVVGTSTDAQMTSNHSTISARFRASSSSTATFPVSVNARLQIGYLDS